MFKGRSWGLLLLILFWPFGGPLIGLALTSSGLSGVLVLRLVCFEHISGWVALFLLASRPLLAGALCRVGGSGWVAGLLGSRGACKLPSIDLDVSSAQSFVNSFSCSCAASQAACQVGC